TLSFNFWSISICFCSSRKGFSCRSSNTPFNKATCSGNINDTHFIVPLSCVSMLFFLPLIFHPRMYVLILAQLSHKNMNACLYFCLYCVILVLLFLEEVRHRWIIRLIPVTMCFVSICVPSMQV